MRLRAMRCGAGACYALAPRLHVSAVQLVRRAGHESPQKSPPVAVSHRPPAQALLPLRKERAGGDKDPPADLVQAIRESKGRVSTLREFARSYKLAVRDGFRSTLDEIRLAARLAWRCFVLGHSYSRRDLELLRRTSKDLFRLLPFASFIMTSGFTMTYLVWARLFPFILPSHFRKSADMIDSRERQKERDSEEGRMEAAKQLRLLTRNVVLQDLSAHDQQRLLQLLDDLQDPHATIAAGDILAVSSLFREAFDLDALDRRLLVRMAQFLGLEVLLPSNVIRFQLRRILRSLRNDDKHISAEGVENLTFEELKAACHKRGLSRQAMGEDTHEVLRRRLVNWLALSLSPQVPPAMLVLYSAFKMEHSSLEEEELGPVEVQLRCLEEERDELLKSKAKLEERLAALSTDIAGLEAKVHGERKPHALDKAQKRLVWAEDLLTDSEKKHIRRVYRKAVADRPTGGALTAREAAAAVSAIQLRGNFILREDVMNYFRQRHGHLSSYRTLAHNLVDEDEFVVMYANLSGRRWQPTWEERRRLALDQLSGMAARVEIEAKERMFK